MADLRTPGPVRIVGTGLLGTSIGLALTARGLTVELADASPSSLELALDYGAGVREAGAEPALIVVCVPPDVTASTVAAELAAHPTAIVTDVASVKLAPLTELERLGADLARYVGSHPMAGRERSGAIAARADLFLGRPWVIATHAGLGRATIAPVEALALDLGATPIELDAAAHDRSVALVSHAPQLVSTLLARRLSGADDAALALAGQGLRDTTRIAASSPELWVQILGANAEPVADILRAYRDELDAVIATLESPAAPGARRALAEVIAGGNAGVGRLPGKHGGPKHFSQLVVIIDDRPGELARLLTEIGELGINMEDLRLEHSPGAAVGLAEISVLPEAEARLASELAARGWKIAGEFA